MVSGRVRRVTTRRVGPGVTILVVATVVATLLGVILISASPGRFGGAAPSAVDTSPVVQQRPAPAAEPAPAGPAPQTDGADADQMAAAVSAAEGAAAGADPAVAILDRRGGAIVVGARGNAPVYTASLAKLVVAVDILDRRRLNGLAVGQSDIALLRRALGPSDDDAMNALWTRFDGQGAPARVSRRVGLAATRAPGRVGQWGEMTVSAADMVHLWQYVLDDMPGADRDLLVSAMDAAPSRAADGFDQGYGLLAPDVRGGHATVAKQGWMCCFSSHYYLHSSGAAGEGRRYLVVVLTRPARGPGWDAARRNVTAAVAAALRELGVSGAQTVAATDGH